MFGVYPDGTPDVLALKDGVARFIEFKSSIGKPSPIQKHIHKELAKQGFKTEII